MILALQSMVGRRGSSAATSERLMVAWDTPGAQKHDQAKSCEGDQLLSESQEGLGVCDTRGIWEWPTILRDLLPELEVRGCSLGMPVRNSPHPPPPTQAWWAVWLEIISPSLAGTWWLLFPRCPVGNCGDAVTQRSGVRAGGTASNEISHP